MIVISGEAKEQGGGKPVSKIDHVKTHIEVENKHDMEAMLATLVDENPIRDEVAGQTYRGRDAVAKRYGDLWEAFPDFTVTPTGLYEDGDVVVMQADYKGTHKGVFNDHPPTGKSFNVRIVVVFNFEGERIASETIYLDYAGQLRQLGLM